MLLKLYLYSIRVKQHTINMLAGLGITLSYEAINNKHDELADLEKVL